MKIHGIWLVSLVLFPDKRSQVSFFSTNRQQIQTLHRQMISSITIAFITPILPIQIQVWGNILTVIYYFTLQAAVLSRQLWRFLQVCFALEKSKYSAQSPYPCSMRRKDARENIHRKILICKAGLIPVTCSGVTMYWNSITGKPINSDTMNSLHKVLNTCSSDQSQFLFMISKTMRNYEYMDKHYQYLADCWESVVNCMSVHI